MSRKKIRRTDRLADHVANQFLAEELERAVGQIPTLHRWTILLVGPDFVPSKRVAADYSAARADPRIREGLLAYLGGQDRGDRCCGCGSLLPIPVRAAGRPRRHCDNACRQLAYRNRIRLASATTASRNHQNIDWNFMDGSVQVQIHGGNGWQRIWPQPG